MLVPDFLKIFSLKADEKKSDMSLSTGMISLQHTGMPIWSKRNPKSLVQNGFSRNVIAYRCIRMIAESAASVPLKVQQQGHVLCDHTILALLAQPNPSQSQASFLEEVYSYLQTAGNAYIEAVALGAQVHEVYALRPDKMEIRAARTGWPVAFEYTVNGQKTIFPANSDDGPAPILHLKMFHPGDDHYGQSPLAVAADMVDIHNSASAWNKALLDNAARPSGALVYYGSEANGNLTTEQFDRLKAELQENYQGGFNAGRPMVLDGGLDWKQMSLSPADMDFINAKNMAAREIALAFGVPSMLLGIPGDNTYTNYKEANFAFWRQTVLPLVTKVVEAISCWLGEDHDIKLVADISKIDALQAEHSRDLDRIVGADFLTDGEKRLALGFPEVSPDQGA